MNEWIKAIAEFSNCDLKVLGGSTKTTTTITGGNGGASSGV